MIEYAVLTAAGEREFSYIRGLLDQLHASSSSTYEPSLSRLQAMVSNENTDVIAARDGEKIVGMAILFTLARIDETSGYVDDVVVDNAYRGKGIATALMQKLIEIARERGHKHLDLTSRPSREAANHLYQKIGFVKRETNPYRLKL